ncbi:hypothetical protein VTN02DRAFT_1158 [Thermoascus thermophilus]
MEAKKAYGMVDAGAEVGGDEVETQKSRGHRWIWISRLAVPQRSSKVYPGRVSSSVSLLLVPRPWTLDVTLTVPSPSLLARRTQAYSTSESPLPSAGSPSSRSMASESLNQPDDGVRGRSQQSPSASQRSTSPYAARPRPSSGLFPLGYKEGFSQWWASIPAAAAEHKVLSFVPFLQQAPTHQQTGSVADTPNGAGGDSLQSQDLSQQGEVTANSVDDPYGPRRWRSSMVELSGKDRALNEFSVERIGEQADQNLVILHGYGAGLGFFYKNFEPLSRAEGWRLYALDMLGMGRSTRPPFKIKAKNRQDAITEAEDCIPAA